MSLPPQVRLANEIAIQFTHIPSDSAASRIADHMRQFWEARMLAALLAYIDEGGTELDPLAARAAERLRQPA